MGLDKKLPELTRIGNELRRLNITIEERADGVAIVGDYHHEPLPNNQPMPVRVAIHKLIRGEQERQRVRDSERAKAEIVSKRVRTQFKGKPGE